MNTRPLGGASRSLLRGQALLLVLFASLTFLSVACPEKIRDEIESAAEDTVHASTRVGQSTELKLLRGQIELYRRLNEGKNPPGLQAMDTLPHLKYEADYSYDPASGVVSSRRFPEL